jgi:predicted short-subunit dehydrogenase-like oxidoreductase (DUF2520 family)
VQECWNPSWHSIEGSRPPNYPGTQFRIRGDQSASTLAERLNCSWTTNLEDLAKDADLYLMAVSDDSIEEIAKQFPFKKALLVHTSGSTSMQALEPGSERTGVFYPLQTFSKDIDLDLSEVPICLESRNEMDMLMLEELAAAISSRSYRVPSDHRGILHVAAVFVCNFVNHMYTLGSDIMAYSGLPFSMLHPLINETARKALKNPPSEIQTGPARRNDKEYNQSP